MDNTTKEQIAATAERILWEEIGLVDGSRRLVKLFNSLNREDWDEALFDPIRAFESETEDLPVGELRSMWNKDSLALREARAKPYLDESKEWILEACRALIAKYGSRAGKVDV